MYIYILGHTFSSLIVPVVVLVVLVVVLVVLAVVFLVPVAVAACRYFYQY